MEEKIKTLRSTHAFYWSSMRPDIMMERAIKDFLTGQEFIKQKCEEYNVESERFLEKHYKLVLAFLSSQARCASTMVTGGSNFNHRKNDKALKSNEKHTERLVYFEQNIEKTLKRITKRQETESDKRDKWVKEIEERKKKQEMMKAFNKESKKNFEEAFKKLDTDLQDDISHIIKFYQGRVPATFDYQLKNNLANIKRLEEQVKTIESLSSKGQEELEFQGGSVKFDPEEIRYNIFFDDKPDEQTRTKIKKRGFKWSPKRGAWTRSAKTIQIQEVIKLVKEG